MTKINVSSAAQTAVLSALGLTDESNGEDLWTRSVATLLLALDVGPEATPEQITAALTALLDGHELPPLTKPEDTEAGDQGDKLSGSLTVMLSGQVRSLSARVDELETEKLTAHRETVVNAAVAEGKIATAQKATYLSAMAIDQKGTETVLASLPANTIPVREIGYAGDAVGTVVDKDEPKWLY